MIIPGAHTWETSFTLQTMVLSGMEGSLSAGKACNENITF